MQVGLRHVGSATIEWFRHAAGAEGQTRHALIRGLCDREGWRDARGRLRLPAAAGVVPGLAAQLGVELPVARPVPAFAPVAPEAPTSVPDLSWYVSTFTIFDGVLAYFAREI